MEEQAGGVVYEAGGEVGAEGGPVMVTQQVLTVSAAEDEEPKVSC